MSAIETLGILEEIEAIVSDRLQVVSYKWLSRNYSVSSNTAKKLLQEFVEKHGQDLEVVYSVAGWLKKDSAAYHIRLVPGPKLAEAKQEFDTSCSVQVFSVQVCIPKDLATLWNVEFIQTEDLFKQPSAVDNCLWDNRFCGISNALVKRKSEGTSVSSSALQTSSSGGGLAPGLAGNITRPLQQPQQKKLPQSSPKVALSSLNGTTAGTETEKSGSHGPQNEALEKKKISVATAKKKGQSDKSSVGTEGSLANLWGRASTKSKSTNCSTEDKIHPPKTNDSADAQVCAHEASEVPSSDDEESDVNFKRASNGDNGKKRRVVIDDSDEDDYENAVNLGSPDPPKGKSFQHSKLKSQTMDIEKNSLNFDEQKECKTKVKEEKTTDTEVKHPVEESSVGMSESIAASEEIIRERLDVDSINKKKATDSVRVSPKRRKVLKTRIDERGREVTEVVWEGEETETMDKSDEKNNIDDVKNHNDHKKKVQDITAAANRAATTKRSPAVGSSVPHAAGKAGNKKGANAKDPKQGNILSFFKKV